MQEAQAVEIAVGGKTSCGHQQKDQDVDGIESQEPHTGVGTYWGLPAPVCGSVFDLLLAIHKISMHSYKLQFKIYCTLYIVD